MWTVYQYINGDLNLNEEKDVLDIFINSVFLSQTPNKYKTYLG